MAINLMIVKILINIYMKSLHKIIKVLEILNKLLARVINLIRNIFKL